MCPNDSRVSAVRSKDNMRYGNIAKLHLAHCAQTLHVAVCSQRLFILGGDSKLGRFSALPFEIRVDRGIQGGRYRSIKNSLVDCLGRGVGVNFKIFPPDWDLLHMNSFANNILLQGETFIGLSHLNGSIDVFIQSKIHTFTRKRLFRTKVYETEKIPKNH